MEAAAARHPHVEECDVRPRRLRAGDRSLRVDGDRDKLEVGLALDQLAERSTKGRLVLSHQDAD